MSCIWLGSHAKKKEKGTVRVVGFVLTFKY